MTGPLVNGGHASWADHRPVLALIADAAPAEPLAAVLDAVLAFVRRFVVISDEQAVAITLWVAHTFVYDRADQSPILAVTSAERRSGKSRLFDVTELLVARPWRCVRPSEAVLFRKIDRDHPTVLVDEGDTMWQDRTGAFDGLRAIFNAGNRRGSPIPRTTPKGRGFDLVDFDVFCPKAIAGIGGLPATVLDRAILIRMTRRRAGEQVARFRERRARAESTALRDKLLAGVDLLATFDVDDDRLPDALDDRARDGWEPLLAIADAAGGAWPDRARTSAVLLAAARDDAADDTDSLSLRLLRDVRDIFDADPDADTLRTTVLVERLVAIEDAPWAATPPRDARLTPHRLLLLVRRYGVRPTRFRPVAGSNPVWGYQRDAFEDAWGRYMPPLNQTTQPTQPTQVAHSERAGNGIAVPPVPPVPSV